jgi:hypothetical protein
VRKVRKISSGVVIGQQTFVRFTLVVGGLIHVLANLSQDKARAKCHAQGKHGSFGPECDARKQEITSDLTDVPRDLITESSQERVFGCMEWNFSKRHILVDLLDYVSQTNQGLHSSSCCGLPNKHAVKQTSSESTYDAHIGITRASAEREQFGQQSYTSRS